MRLFSESRIIRRVVYRSLIVIGLVPCTAVADQRSSAGRYGSAGVEQRVAISAVDKANITRFEALLAKKTLVGGSPAKRIRLYAYDRTSSRRLMVAVLALPDWRGQRFNLANVDKNDPLTWNTGSYLVTSRDLPSRVSVVPDTSCSLIRVQYDIHTQYISANTCIQSEAMEQDKAGDKAVVLEIPSRICIYSKVDPRVDKELQDVDRLGLALTGGRDLSVQASAQMQSSLQKSGVGIYGKGGSPIVSTFSNMSAALAACTGEHNAVMAMVGVSLIANGKPYRLTAQITQAGHSMSSTFDRDALAILTPYYRSLGPMPWSDKPPALRAGPNLSVDGDIGRLFSTLLHNVVWRKS